MCLFSYFYEDLLALLAPQKWKHTLNVSEKELQMTTLVSRVRLPAALLTRPARDGFGQRVASPLRPRPSLLKRLEPARAGFPGSVQTAAREDRSGRRERSSRAAAALG